MAQSFGIAACVEPAAPLPRYALDRGNRCLWRERQRLDLPPKAFDVLDFLRCNPGRLVTQDEILDQVWPNRFVQPEIVKTYIRTLRRLLEDDVRRPRFIETRPRSGYRFLGELPDRQEGLTAPATMVGRDAERAVLSTALDAARTGRRGCVLVTGEAGLGKSTLLDATLHAARSEPGVLAAACYGAPTRFTPEPLSLAIALLQDLARAVDRTALQDAVAAHAPGWAFYLVPGAGAPAGERPAWWAQQMVREACALIEYLATDAVVLLAIDDLQWADADTVDLVVSLATRRYPARLLLVTAFRQIEFVAPCPIQEAMRDLVLQARVRELALPPLPLRDLIGVLGAPARDAAVDCDVIATESGGNPRLLQALAAFGGCTGPNEPAGAFAAPPCLDLQFGRMADKVRQALEAGSIAGPRFCAWAVAAILGAEQSGTEDLLARLVSSHQFLLPDGGYVLPDGARTPIYAFRHPVHRRALLHSQAPSLRSARYRRFGEAIVAFWGDGVKDVANDVSQCFKFAGDWSDAIAYSRLAAQQAAERDHPVDALRLLEEALACSAKLPLAERIAVQTPIRRDIRTFGGAPEPAPRRA